jgi:hypothetical protein
MWGHGLKLRGGDNGFLMAIFDLTLLTNKNWTFVDKTLFQFHKKEEEESEVWAEALCIKKVV